MPNSAARSGAGSKQAGAGWRLHGTSGGRAERVEGSQQRRTVKTEHHALLGSYFLTHPPIQKIQVDVARSESPLTRGLGTSFDVEDEPYFIELQDPGSTHVLLTSDYGPGATSPTIGSLYEKDTSLRPDGKTRVLGYTRDVGRGAVAYFTLGHCHNPAIRSARASRSRGHDAAHVSRRLGDRGVRHAAAERDLVGRRRSAR